MRKLFAFLKQILPLLLQMSPKIKRLTSTVLQHIGSLVSALLLALLIDTGL